jgi:hypothetical protein
LLSCAGLPILAPGDIADVVVELVRDDPLAGRAMLVRNGLPRELLRVPEAPALFR